MARTPTAVTATAGATAGVKTLTQARAQDQAEGAVPVLLPAPVLEGVQGRTVTVIAQDLEALALATNPEETRVLVLERDLEIIRDRAQAPDKS